MEIAAACHVHSSWSYDGSWSLKNLSNMFAKRGCRVLMMTEHDRGFTASRFREFREACLDVSTSDIVVIPGIEYSDADNRVHVLVWGLDSFLGENLPTLTMLEGVHTGGGLAVLAHPSRMQAWTLVEPSWVELLGGIEVWNRKYDGWAPSRTAPALLNSDHLMPFIGLDFHTHRQKFPLVMEVDVDGEVTEATVISSLKARRCQARAFGQPLYGNALHVSQGVLRIAEQGRRMAASVARSARTIVGS